MKWLFPAAFIIGIAFLVYFAITDSDEPGGGRAPSTRYSALDVRADCREAILEQLVSPGTARFIPGVRPEYVPQERGWAWATLVDSENRFGALLRTKWSCTWYERDDEPTVYLQE